MKYFVILAILYIGYLVIKYTKGIMLLIFYAVLCYAMLPYLLGHRCKVFRTRGLTPPPLGAVVVHSGGAYNTADWQVVVLNIELLIILPCLYLPQQQ